MYLGIIMSITDILDLFKVWVIVTPNLIISLLPLNFFINIQLNTALLLILMSFFET